MTAWNPDTYLRFESERTRPASELLARVPLDAPSLVYDLGCGPGNSTRLIAQRWPTARLVGVDRSPDMLRRATQSGVAAEWLEADIAEWQPAEPPGLIFSNATLQWLPNHSALFDRFMEVLPTGGALAVQMPRNFTSASHTIIQHVVETGPWAERLMPLKDFNPVARPEDYYARLADRAESIDVWETEYVHVLRGEDAVYHWIKGTALTPYLDALAGRELDDFVTQLKERLGAAYRRRANGVTLFPFRRLFLVALKGGA